MVSVRVAALPETDTTVTASSAPLTVTAKAEGAGVEPVSSASSRVTTSAEPSTVRVETLGAVVSTVKERIVAPKAEAAVDESVLLARQ